MQQVGDYQVIFFLISVNESIYIHKNLLCFYTSVYSCTNLFQNWEFFNITLHLRDRLIKTQAIVCQCQLMITFLCFLKSFPSVWRNLERKRLHPFQLNWRSLNWIHFNRTVTKLCKWWRGTRWQFHVMPHIVIRHLSYSFIRMADPSNQKQVKTTWENMRFEVNLLNDLQSYNH